MMQVAGGAHFINLSRGVLCPHVVDLDTLRYIRIQSTWCEQKRWADVIMSVGADLLINAATGVTCIIHDVSERQREPRAIWQGVEFIRYCCEKSWNGTTIDIRSRGGNPMRDYFGKVWTSLPTTATKMIHYYRQYHVPGAPVNIRGCGFITGRES